MEKHDKRSRLKSESSDEEEDFASADEGDENEANSTQQPSWKATSPNSTLSSNVTKDTSKLGSTDMTTELSDLVSAESSLHQERTYEETVKSGDGVEAKTPISGSTDHCNPSSQSHHQTLSDVLKKDEFSIDNKDDIHAKTDEKEPILAANNEQVKDDTAIPDQVNDTLDTKALVQDKAPQNDSDKTTSVKQEETSWGWGSWGTMLSQASAGISSVIESVESTLGIPEPEEIAKKLSEDEKNEQPEMNVGSVRAEDTENRDDNVEDDNEKESQASVFSVLGVAGLSSVVSEGLGALEYIGKKTMDVISEGDPGLRNKREQLMPKGPTLSQMLKEAKEEAEYKAAHPDFKESILNIKLSTEFDTYQGLAHLEALEILSKECEVKVEAQIIDSSKEELLSIKPLLRTIQEVMQIEDEEDHEDEQEQDLDEEITSILNELHLNHIPNKTKVVHAKSKEWINTFFKEQTDDPNCKDHVEVYTAAISTLAELTACTVEQFHKIAEVMLLLAEENDISSLVRAQALKKLSLCVCKEVSSLASKYAMALNTISKESEDPNEIESLITNLYLESSDSCQYVQHAFKLLCPVLQKSSLSETAALR